MSKTKLYVASLSDELCYPLSRHLEGARHEGWETIELYECHPEKVPGIGWCHEFEAYIEKGENPCGRLCPKYAPRNGRAGCCKHYTATTYDSGDKVVFDVKTGKPLINQ